MTPKSQLQKRLKEIVGEIREELQNRYTREQTTVLVQKLNAILENLDFVTHKKSLAILLSPGFERIYYLDFRVNEKNYCGRSFQS